MRFCFDSVRTWFAQNWESLGDSIAKTTQLFQRFDAENPANLNSRAEWGEKAKAFVEEKLKGLDFVVIKTYKTDMYGRYVSDIFYLPTSNKKEEIYEKGFFLNDDLLKAGLADIVT